jgi:CRISPR-associated protein Csn2
MTNTITVFPYKPFEINDGITLLNFQNIDEYSNLIFRINKLENGETFSDDTNRIIHFYTDDDDPIEEHLKDICFIGDLGSFNLNASNQMKIILKKIIEDSQIMLNEIEKVNTDLNSVVFDSITRYSLPLTFDMYANYEKLLKSKGIKIDSSNWANYCDKLMDVISFYSDFTNKKLLIFNNICRLLNVNQLNEIHTYLKSVDLKLVSLESYPMIFKEEKLNAKVYSIDNDHVRFDY